MRTGYRKLLLTVIALVVFGVVASICAIKNITCEYFGLGIGLGMLLAPSMTANAFEHKYRDTTKV